jgi:tetratricopeptide (TPR) repeat protein
MIALPRTKVEELIARLEPHMDQVGRLDAFTLQRYKKEALQNLHIYPWAGHIALGMIAVLEWDEVAIDTAYRNALALRNDSVTHAHYSTALQLIGKYEQAVGEAVIASAMAPENLSYLGDAIIYAQAAGQLTLAKELLEKYEQRSPLKEHETAESVMHALSVLEMNGISQDVVSRCNALAFEILRQHRVAYVSAQLETDTQDNYMMYYIQIDAPEEVIERLDEELGIALFDKVPEFHPDKYWVGFAKASVRK